MFDRRGLLLLAGLLVASGCLSAEERYAALKSNPFLQHTRLPVSGGGDAPAAEPAAVAMSLRATMVAGQHSQANIGGLIVGLGEEVNGYRLDEVHARHVVLVRDGIQKEISIDDGKTDRN